MVVATADATGQPVAAPCCCGAMTRRVRVLHQLRVPQGPRAGREPAASLVFSWVPLERQVIVTGTVGGVRGRVGGLLPLPAAGEPARRGGEPAVVGGRVPAELERAWRRWRAVPGGAVPAPANWGGIRVAPDSVEFWQGRPARLHDRLRYRRRRRGVVVERLAP